MVDRVGWRRGGGRSEGGRLRAKDGTTKGDKERYREREERKVKVCPRETSVFWIRVTCSRCFLAYSSSPVAPAMASEQSPARHDGEIALYPQPEEAP